MTAMFVGEAWEETENKQGYFYLPFQGYKVSFCNVTVEEPVSE